MGASQSSDENNYDDFVVVENNNLQIVPINSNGILKVPENNKQDTVTEIKYDFIPKITYKIPESSAKMFQMSSQAFNIPIKSKIVSCDWNDTRIVPCNTNLFDTNVSYLEKCKETTEEYLDDKLPVEEEIVNYYKDKFYLPPENVRFTKNKKNKYNNKKIRNKRKINLSNFDVDHIVSSYSLNSNIRNTIKYYRSLNF